MAGAFIGESGAVDIGFDLPTLSLIGQVIDGDDRDVAQVAQHPLHGAVGTDADAVGVLTVLERSVGELGLAVDPLRRDLTPGAARLGLDEDVTVLVGRQLDGVAGLVRGARRGRSEERRVGKVSSWRWRRRRSPRTQTSDKRE